MAIKTWENPDLLWLVRTWFKATWRKIPFPPDGLTGKCQRQVLDDAVMKQTPPCCCPNVSVFIGRTRVWSHNGLFSRSSWKAKQAVGVEVHSPAVGSPQADKSLTQRTNTNPTFGVFLSSTTSPCQVSPAESRGEIGNKTVTVWGGSFFSLTVTDVIVGE